jgi:hypothetical protein
MESSLIDFRLVQSRNRVTCGHNISILPARGADSCPPPDITNNVQDCSLRPHRPNRQKHKNHNVILLQSPWLKEVRFGEGCLRLLRPSVTKTIYSTPNSRRDSTYIAVSVVADLSRSHFETSSRIFSCDKGPSFTISSTRFQSTSPSDLPNILQFGL